MPHKDPQPKGTGKGGYTDTRATGKSAAGKLAPVDHRVRNGARVADTAARNAQRGGKYGRGK